MLLVGVLLIGLLLVAACGGSDADRSAQAAAMAERFSNALQDEDFADACALLAPRTLSELEASAKKPCAAAIEEEQLPRLGANRGTTIYGTQALVRGESDTLFLAEFGGDWRIVAAGCAPRRESPYDCSVKGA
jgi:hypothetical protein